MHTGSLQLVEGEASAQADLGVVAGGRAPDDRSERFDWSRVDARRSLETCTSSPLLAHRLIEPASYVPLPVLVQVVHWNRVLSFDGHFDSDQLELKFRTNSEASTLK